MKEWTQQHGCGDKKVGKIKRMFLISGFFWAVQGLGEMAMSPPTLLPGIVHPFIALPTARRSAGRARTEGEKM